MDAHIKEGQLYVQHLKFGKKWKKNWFVLYPASPNGIARLEFFDSPSGNGVGASAVSNGSSERTRKLDKKIIRLAECITILPSLTENCPKDDMAAFCVETNDKTHVFAAQRLVAQEWMDLMCDIAFQGAGGSALDPGVGSGASDLKMSENLIYCSRGEEDDFWVAVQKTEASERCGLSGGYWLKAERDVLVLKEPGTRRKVQVWPYRFLRRYGRDRVMFSFDAGRRCDSGPGNFTFDTKQGNEIFSLVDRAIQSQRALAEERRLSCNPEPDAAPPPRGTPPPGDVFVVADGESEGSCQPCSADGALSHREGAEAEGGRGRSLLEQPMGGAGTSPPSARSRGAGGSVEQAGLYSEPVDCVRLPRSDPLYSDPVDSLHAPSPAPQLRSEEEGPQTDPPDLYSHVYDRISAEVSSLSLNETVSSGRGAPRAFKSAPAGQEHIYDEPEGCAKGTGLSKTIYDEATAPSGQERHYSPISQTKSPETPSWPIRGIKWPKPPPAPKPLRAKRKEPGLAVGKQNNNSSNNNNNNSNSGVSGGASGELCSKVSKQKPLHSSKESRGLRPDVIYDNLGNI